MQWRYHSLSAEHIKSIMTTFNGRAEWPANGLIDTGALLKLLHS